MKISQLRDFANEKLGDHGADLIRKAALAGGTRALGVIFSFGLFWLVGRHFGETGIAYLSIPQSMLMILRIVVSMGVGLALVRLLAQLSEAGNSGWMWSRYLTAMTAAIPVSIAAGLTLMLLSGWIADSAFGNPEMRWAVAATGAALPFFTIGQLNAEVARGLKRIVASEVFRTLGIPFVAFILFAIWLARGEAGVNAPFQAYFCGIVVVAAISVIFAVLTLRKKHQRPPPGDRLGVQQLLTLSAPMMLGEFGVILLGRVDHLMLEILSTSEDAGVYGLVLRLSAIGLFIPAAIGVIAAPKIAGIYWSGDRAAFRRTAVLIARLMFAGALLPTVILCAAPGFWMGLFGAGFERGGWALVGLCLAGLVISSTGFIGSILNMTGSEKFYRNIILFALALNIVLNLILIPILGVNGAAISSLATVLIWNAAAVVHIRRKHGFLLLPFAFSPRRTGPDA